MQKEITQENLDTLFAMNDEIVVLKDKGNTLLTNAKSFHKNRIEIERGGKKFTITENHLWDEITALGVESEAGKILAQKYPETFEVHKDIEQKADKMKMFVIEHFGFDFKAMTLTDYIKLTVMLFEFLLKKYQILK